MTVRWAFAVWKNPENLTDRQQAKARHDPADRRPVYRAYLVWAASGPDRRTVLAFFDQPGEERCKQIELVSADMATWISGPIAGRVPQAVRCVDPFHVVMLATDALDDVRRELWNEARREGDLELVREMKGALEPKRQSESAPVGDTTRGNVRRFLKELWRPAPCRSLGAAT